MDTTHPLTLPRLACHCLVTRPGNAEPELLMLQRIKPPYVGKWVVPGGKVEPDEYMADAARRELWEETGLRGPPLTPRALLHERSASPDWQWLIMLYRGELDVDMPLINGGHGPEGQLRWQPLSALTTLDCSPIDRWLYQRLLSPDAPDFETLNVYFPKANEGDLLTFVIE